MNSFQSIKKTKCSVSYFAIVMFHLFLSWRKMGHFKALFGCFGSLADAQLQPLAIFQPNLCLNIITEWTGSMPGICCEKNTPNFEFRSIFAIFGFFGSFSPPMRRLSNSWGHQGGHLWCPGASPNHTPTTILQPAKSETKARIWNTPISQYNFD